MDKSFNWGIMVLPIKSKPSQMRNAKCAHANGATQRRKKIDADVAKSRANVNA